MQQHLDKKEPMAFISAHVDDLPTADNKDRTYGLYRLARAYQFGYNKISGGYTMDDGSLSEEQSVVVYAKPDEQDELFEFAKKAAKLYEQESILLADTDGVAFFYYAKSAKKYNEGDIYKSGEFTASDVDKYFSQIGQKRFTFKNKAEIEEQKDFSYKGSGMSDSLLHLYNRENLRRQVGKK